MNNKCTMLKSIFKGRLEESGCKLGCSHDQARGLGPALFLGHLHQTSRDRTSKNPSFSYHIIYHMQCMCKSQILAFFFLYFCQFYSHLLNVLLCHIEKQLPFQSDLRQFVTGVDMEQCLCLQRGKLWVEMGIQCPGVALSMPTDTANSTPGRWHSAKAPWAHTLTHNHTHMHRHTY